MKAQSVNENVNFERGQDPKDALDIGAGKNFMIITLDAEDEFDSLGEDPLDGSLMEVEGPMSYQKAKTKYEEIAGYISNVYLVEVLESVINI